MVTRLAWMAHKLVSSKRLTREASEASWRATVPGLYLWGFFTPPVAGADLRAALVANCFLGAFPPVDFLAVCFVRAMVTVKYYLLLQHLTGYYKLNKIWNSITIFQ